MTDLPSPHLTPEQREAALEKAAKARKERAELLHQVTTMPLPELLAAGSDENVLGKMKVSALLAALPGFDRITALQIMERLAIPMSCRVRGLGSRQREALELAVSRAQTDLLRRQEQADRDQARSVIEISLETRHDPRFPSNTGASGVFHLKVPWPDKENVRLALQESGAAPFREPDDGVQNAISTAPEFAVLVIAASSGAWLCIRAVINGLAERNRYKKFRFTLPGGAKLEADGYSNDQLAAVVQLVTDHYAEHLRATENPDDLRQALAHAARKLLDQRESWPADEEIDFYFKQAAKVLDNPGGDGGEKLPKWVASAVERIRELPQAAPAGSGDAARVLAEVTELLAALPHEQRG